MVIEPQFAAVIPFIGEVTFANVGGTPGNWGKVDGGKLVLPLGHPFSFQNLVVVTKEGEDYRLEQIAGVLFVPMTGKALEKYR